MKIQKLIKPSALLWIMLGALCTGCSVKEDRGKCPCLLSLEYSGEEAEITDYCSVRISGADGFFYNADVGFVGGTTHVVEVPKGDIGLGIYSFRYGDGRTSDSERCVFEAGNPGITIVEGNECPPIYMYASSFYAGEEQHAESFVLHKNYCRVTIKFITSEMIHLGLKVVGNVCGYGVGGKPAEGSFSFVPEIGADHLTSVCIPRQEDGSLRLYVTDEENVLREFALGEYIVASGYDWNSEDLEDVEVEIDYAYTEAVFRILDWDEVVEFEEVI